MNTLGKKPYRPFGNGDFFKSLFMSNPLPSIVLGPDMEVWEVNREFLSRYGLSRAQVIGKRCYNVFHQSDQPCDKERCSFEEAIKGASNCRNYHEFTTPEGDNRVEEVLLTPLVDSGGRIWAVMESIRDITEEVRLRRDMEEANELLNRILDSLVGVVVAVDKKGDILFVNRSAGRVLGYDPEELVGEPLKLLSDPVEIRRMNDLLKANQGQALFVHTKVYTKDGEEIPVRMNASYVYRDNEPVATVSIFTDLREHLAMEDKVIQARMQVIQSDKLAGLGRMAAGVAHELNNPLTGILVYADLLRESLPKDDPAQADLDCIVEDAERCQNIVKGMLEYSRQSEIQVEDLDLNQLVEDAFSLIRDNSVLLGVEIARKYHPEPLKVQGDRKLLRQVFINLIMNAVDAMEGKGSIEVSSGLDHDGWRFVEIKDTGPGIPDSHLRKVFDPFFTTKEIGKGTGLGLSVVFGVLQRHGGKASVVETGPEGTTFRVSLPRSAPIELQELAKAYGPLTGMKQD